ncbi:MAG: prolyl oligopeptidase family serine peptidase [Candidatus Saccharicenans sp.]|jgi:dipeptidyl aminopeptidase/acylaminoacyl peptidase|nr:prolyl oligopeptidase family serine peptidase [Candidatus Saccharicenans sp.]MDH7576125.1 prolyl oligopeptidase family serine peptidase [Candidatus Saccharicenans sp.]
MRGTNFRKKWSGLVVIVLVLFALAQAQTGKKPIGYDVYDSWKSIQGTKLSGDGRWLVYSLAPGEGDPELVVLDLQSGKESRFPRGRDAVISADDRFVVYTIVPPKAEVDKAKKEKKKPEEQPKNGLGIINLQTGQQVSIDRVKNFKLAEDSGKYVAYLLEPPLPKEAAKDQPKKEEEKKEPEKKEPEAKPAEKKEPEQKAGEKKEEKKPEKKKEPGTELVIRNLETNETISVQEVSEYTWSKNGRYLAYAVSSKKPEDDGAFILDPSSGKTIALLKGQGHYVKLAFDERGQQLAFLSDRDSYQEKASPYKLYLWQEKMAAAVEVAGPKTTALPPGHSPSENREPSFSRDGSLLFFGYAPVPEPAPEDAPEPVKVDIWSWTDPELQPMQKVRADEEKKKNFLAVCHLNTKDKKMVRLASEDLPEIRLSDDSQKALGSNPLPYRQLVSWDRSYSDYYLVDIKTGARTKILEKFPSSVSFSPGGNYLVYYDDQTDAWYTYRLADGRRFDLTSRLGVNFFREEWDTPSEPPAYGLAGWTENDASVLIYDRYDLWEIKPDGSSAKVLTGKYGRENKVNFRYLRLDPEEKAISLKKPLILLGTNEITKASGFFRLDVGRGDKPEKLIYMDKLLGGLQKAKKADRYVFTIQTFEEFPDLWVSGPDFGNARKVSQANPQQAEYLWGQAELITYLNADGKELQAVLIKPENFDPKQKYPLMVYIYERLSDQLHRYYAPGPGTNINFTRYVSNGYVILMPDIVYEVGYPGLSSLKCVVPAVETVVGMGFIDPRRIGIQGHSWGGYQITYLITRTNIFAACEAGAAVSNMVSAYGGIRWGTGMSRAFQYEKTQSRIGTPPWERALQFIENSPIFWVERVQTPYLTIHNDEDDAVPWYQGIEFFTALRRLGKPAWMFVFNGEKHGLRQRENQKYWTVHLDEFFDHYLKGAPQPEWMKKGVTYLERGKRDVSSLFQAKTEEGKAKN